MKNAIFLDVDNTLILTVFNKDGTRSRVYNETLLTALQKQGSVDLFLFTNMDLSDLNGPQENRISRAELVSMLVQRGFTVHGVITPADPAYNKGPGKAYEEIYLPAHKKAKKKGDISKYVTAFDGCASQIVVDEQYTKNERAAGQKLTMLRYFLQHKPQDLENILYFDDDVSCLKACAIAAQEAGINLTTCQVDPARLIGNSDAIQMTLSQEAERIDYEKQLNALPPIDEEQTSTAKPEKKKGKSLFARFFGASSSSSSPAPSSSRSPSPAN